MDKLNTRNLMRRRNFQIENGNYNCVLCRENLEETALHLFYTCTFSRACWEKIGVLWNFNFPFYNIMKDARQNSNNFFTKTFIIAAWEIGKQRYNFIFEGRRPSLRAWTSQFVEEAILQAHRLKDSNKQVFLDWVNSV
jgi:hypothetical protein